MEKIGDYKILSKIQENGENANVFLVENLKGKKFILKHFNKAVKSHIPYAKINHFGRRREGHELVFNEIKEASLNHDFLITFHKRFKWNQRWCIVIDYFDGITLNEFLRINKDDEGKVISVVKVFAKEVKLWHQNKFALGDPHLDNVLVNPNTHRVKLIDYSQLHNESFRFCEKYDCFRSDPNKRIKEDLINESKTLGKGFITELNRAKLRYEIESDLGEIFFEEYKK
jgi:serine/threonine protein kinase